MKRKLKKYTSYSIPRQYQPIPFQDNTNPEFQLITFWVHTSASIRWIPELSQSEDLVNSSS